jgi:hypothetical protein
MSTEVKIHIKPHMVLPDVFDWIQVEQGWKHIIDWRWSRPPSDSSRDSRYTFQFEKEEHAALFSLKWL